METANKVHSWELRKEWIPVSGEVEYWVCLECGAYGGMGEIPMEVRILGTEIYLPVDCDSSLVLIRLYEENGSLHLENNKLKARMYNMRKELRRLNRKGK